ncbi:magnesium-translocating P-type ATPase [Lactococcus cremoris]|uniref:magnesium-translocating P-type ATPase n=1 Tax=Lactococcus lactis subsp. cremoris TaxID=1359 RepID=UPI00038ABB97|nr:magnesium-translocating P-type ATPase [Lactococcus cremoris]EQC82625.1 magnesium-transporting ATPase [Lactococcus cremoris subsp. cremoris TIFN7]MCT0498197.1 magnesium-translocating P-type ATPase [Lactococcus cremoris]
MKKLRKTLENTKRATNFVDNNEIKRRLEFARVSSKEELFQKFKTSDKGLSEEQVEISREQYGDNSITRGKKTSLIKRLYQAFINPFTIILFVLALVSAFTDIILAAPGEKNPQGLIIITTMVLISGILRFVQETRSGNAAENLLKMITRTTNVHRLETGSQEIPIEEVLVGDIIHLSAGDMVPADLRIIQAKDLFISQASLTGESEPVEKLDLATSEAYDSITESSNLAFMGSNIISGSAYGIVIVTGDNTIFGEMARSVTEDSTKTTFEKGVNSVSWVLIRFMLVMVPFVLLINGFTKGDWMEAALFALAVAVGLTPEMLPMIVTTCLAKGAVTMSKEKTIIKNLNSIQNLGSMNILCTDKTGTLTQDKVVLMRHLDIHGQENIRVLRHGFLNSYYQTGLKNLMDLAIIEGAEAKQEKNPDLSGLSSKYTKVDEIPFDFERRRMSVVVQSNGNGTNAKTQMITKGAAEEMLDICTLVEDEGKIVPLNSELRQYILKKVDELNELGMRVILVAQKTNPSPIDSFSVQDESDMVLMGYLAFLDPPKESTAKAIKALNKYGVSVKILTGDNDKVTRSVCEQVGLPADKTILGSDIDQLDDEELAQVAKEASVFAKLSPQQKARIVTTLRNSGNSVGYMGDGINDAAAMKASDVGISVDSAVDIAKESADVILLEKDLMVLEKGIIEGRKTYANMIKYIKMTASSNFGNMFSVLIASAFLPFIPMLSIHILLLNLIYDFSCTAIPWDNVDEEYLVVPRKWDASSVSKFMLWIGPTSSVFDITTYLLMFFVICPATFGPFSTLVPGSAAYIGFIALFHTGWFIESMWTQTLVIHMIRTPKIPFLQSRASAPLTLLAFLGIIGLTIIPFTSFGKSIGLMALPLTFFPWLILTVVMYMFLVTLFKKIFVSKYGELL